MTNVFDFRDRLRWVEQELDIPPSEPGDPGAQWDTSRDGPPPSRIGEAGAFVEMSDTEREAVEAYPFQGWSILDPAAIPYPEFVYGDFYARGYMSVTAAPPKVGKSMLGMAEGVDMASGRGFLTGRPAEPRRVLYFNAEDDQDVINARIVALLQRYGIDQADMVGRLFAHSGVNRPPIHLVSGQVPVLNERLFVSIERFCQEQRIDAVIFDPLQDLHSSPETNEVFRLLGQRLRLMASTCKVAVGMIHHTRKASAGIAPSIDDMRGGSALRGTARFNRLLVPMTDEEAGRAGVPDRHHYFRIGDVESNLAPPSSEVNRWFHKASVTIANGKAFGVVERWEWPDAFDGVSTADARRVRTAFAEAEGDPPRFDIRSPDWAGHLVGRILGIDTADKENKAARARAQSLIATWLKSEVLELGEGTDKAKGKKFKVVIAGPNALLDGGAD
jgi:hypothetical protein